jgi:hypothetical protein
MGGGDAGNLSGGATLGAALGAQSGTVNVAGSTGGSLSVVVSAITMDGPNTITTSNPGVGQNHGGPDHRHANIISTGGTSGSLSVAASGSHSTVQPTRVLNYLIRI